MPRYIYGHDETVAHAVAQMIPSCRERGFGKCTAIGVINDEGALIAGIVYHEWNPETGVIQISAAALPRSHWFTRETIRRMYDYPFVQLGCQMVIQVTPADDERLLRQLASGGYMFVRVPRLLGRDRDAVLCLFTREDWQSNRFINRALRRHNGCDQEAA